MRNKEVRGSEAIPLLPEPQLQKVVVRRLQSESPHCPARDGRGMNRQELPRDAAADLAEPWWPGGFDCHAGACLLVEYWVSGGAGVGEHLLVHGFLLVPGSTLVSVL